MKRRVGAIGVWSVGASVTASTLHSGGRFRRSADVLRQAHEQLGSA